MPVVHPKTRMAFWLMLCAVLLNSLTHIAALSGHLVDEAWLVHQRLHVMREMLLGIGLTLICLYVLFALFRRGHSKGRIAMASVAFFPIFAPWLGYGVFGIGEPNSPEYIPRIINHGLQVVFYAAALLAWRAKSSYDRHQ